MGEGKSGPCYTIMAETELVCAFKKKLSACSVKNGLSWSKNGRNGSKESIQKVLQVCK